MAWSIEASLAGAKASALARAARMKGKNPLKELRSGIPPGQREQFTKRRGHAVLHQLENRYERLRKKALLYGPKHRLGIKNATMAEKALSKLKSFKQKNPAFVITGGGR